MFLLRIALLALLAISYVASGQMEASYPTEQPVLYGMSQSSTYSQTDEGLTPASGYYMPRNIQTSQTSPNEFTASIPNQLVDSGQTRSDGTLGSYTNVGSSGGADSRAFLGFDISSIPKEAIIRSAALEFDGCDVVGTPFSSLGCLNIYTAAYRQLGSQSYSSSSTSTPCAKICLSSQLNSQLSSSDLARALQASVGQQKFQLYLQFDGGTAGLASSQSSVTSRYVDDVRSSSSSLNLPASDTSGVYSSYGSSNDALSGLGLDSQTMQDMGFDRTFVQSERPMGEEGLNSRYVLLTPGLNLAKLGITKEMLQNASDPGRVSVLTNYMYEKASVNSTGPDAYSRDVPVGGNGPQLCEVLGKVWDPIGQSCCRGCCLDDDGDGICNCPSGETYDPTTGSCKAASSSPAGCPEGYCLDSDSDGVCDLSTNAIGVAHIGWISRDPVVDNNLEGRHAEDLAGRSVEGLTGNIRSLSPNTQSCCQDFNNDGMCDGPTVPSGGSSAAKSIGSSSIIKIGVVWLKVTYSLPTPNVPQPVPIPGGNPDLSVAPGVNPDLGVGDFKLPEPMNLINATSAGWGEVPSNQVLVEIDSTLSFEEARTIARQLANALGGQVVGELQYINLFQIETQSQSLDELIRDISNSRNYHSVALAFPNQQVYRESSPLDDSLYRGENGKSYEIIGVRDAWDEIHGAHINLSKVRVGVTDDGLYEGYGEFHTININTSIKIYEGAPPSLLTSPKPGYEIAGSHGTGVMNILAADPDDGGLVGIASEPLGGKLGVDMVNILYPIKNQEKTFITISLLGLKDEIEDGCTILSCSWGNSKADPEATVAYENWFKKLSVEHPDLLFVCSAGNDRGEMDVTKRIPNGLPNSPDSLPNVLTVGNILNNGDMCPLSNRNSNNKFVSLAAPGEQAVWGMDNSGRIYNSSGGTSMATPQVAAAAALIRSINPSLTAGEIKDILTKTGRNNIGGKKAPADLGGVVLAIDKAIDRVISERPAKIETPPDVRKVVDIPTYDNSDVQGSADTTYHESGSTGGYTGFDATVTIRSTQYKGYDVSVDGSLLGTEGKGQDALDGIFTFKVAGNQQHLIRADHPQNWKRWQYFYNAGESYTYDF
jgi:hypothetical protein